jgi:hypothetical protein
LNAGLKEGKGGKAGKRPMAVIKGETVERLEERGGSDRWTPPVGGRKRERGRKGGSEPLGDDWVGRGSRPRGELGR